MENEFYVNVFLNCLFAVMAFAVGCLIGSATRK